MADMHIEFERITPTESKLMVILVSEPGVCAGRDVCVWWFGCIGGKWEAIVPIGTPALATKSLKFRK